MKPTVDLMTPIDVIYVDLASQGPATRSMAQATPSSVPFGANPLWDISGEKKRGLFHVKFMISHG